MMRHIPVLVTLSALLLSACGDGDNDDRPVDGRDTDGLYEPTNEPYAGRVIDGYLQNARVWIDLDGDYQYDVGPVDVPLDSNPERTITLEGGEPTAMTGPGGRFTLDVSAFEIDPSVGPNLDPRTFPLVAVAIPGVTEEETPAGNVLVDRAFMMSAEPGTQNITPLTTVADARRRQELGPQNVTDGSVGQALSSVNISGDFVRSKDERAQAYAHGLVRFLKDQFPEDNDVREQKGLITTFDQSALRILQLTLLRYTDDIISAIDIAAAGGRYANVDVGMLPLPQVPLDLTNPILLKSVRVRAPSADKAPSSETFITNGESTSAELSFNYSEEGVLESIDADGCMSPSLYDMARLANVGGRVGDLATQGFEGFYLKLEPSRTYWKDDKINERLVFDYANKQAKFFTTTSCHGDLARSSEMGDEPQNTYSWTMGDDGVDYVQSSETSESVQMEYTSNDVDPLFGYLVTNKQGKMGDFKPTGPITSCLGQVDPDDKGKSRIITGQQPYTFDGTPDTLDGESLYLDWDVRGNQKQLLRRVLSLPSLVSDSPLQWEYSYITDDQFVVPERLSLIRTASLSRVPVNNDTNVSNDYIYNKECGRPAVSFTTANVYTLLNHDYIFLADYLEQAP